MGDVIFVAARDVVLVHHDRAEHIARALGWRPESMVREQMAALPAMPPRPRQAPRTAARAPVVIMKTASWWRAACGWLGVVAGAMVFMRR
jgi:hypothetical protein